MKNLFKALSILLAISMVFCISGCKKKGTSDEGSYYDDSDFFADSVEVVSDGATDSDANTASDASKNGSKGSSGTTSKTTTTKSTEGKSWKQVLSGMPSRLKNTTIEVYNWNAANEYTGALKVIENFTKQTGIKVKWTTESYENYLSKLASRVAAGNAPDLVRLCNPLPTTLTSIQSIDAMKYDFSDKAWDSWAMNSYTFNNKTFGVSLSGTHISSPRLLAYNKSLIRKYDLDDPYQLWKNGKWTYDKLMAISQDFKDASGNEYAITGFGTGIELVGIAGTVRYDGQKYVSTMGDSNMLESLQRICDDMNTKKLYSGNYNTEGMDSGKLLFFLSSGIQMRRMNSYFQTLKSANSIGAVPLPTYNGKDLGTFYGELEAYGLAKGAKNPEATPYFLRYFLDSSNYDMDAFFANSQCREVYDYLMSQNKKTWTTGIIDHEGFTKIADTGIEAPIYNATGAQVKSAIDKVKPLVENRAKNLNDILAKIK